MSLLTVVIVCGFVGLAGLGATWLASRRRSLPLHSHGLVSLAQTLFWIAPALTLVAVVAMYKQPIQRPDSQDAVTTGQPAVPARDPNLLWSRQQVAAAPAWAKPEEEAKKPGAHLTVSLIRKGAHKVTGGEQFPAIVVSSDAYATEEEASKELTPRVVEAVTEELRSGFPVAGNWQVPLKLIATTGITANDHLVLEQFDKDFGLGKPDTMYRLHCQVPLTSELRDVVYRHWRSQVVHSRMSRLGAGTGMIVGVLAIASLYLGVNTATQGMYRWRLRLAGASGLLAVLSAGIMLLRM